jgi:hypothetical protein
MLYFPILVVICVIFFHSLLLFTMLYFAIPCCYLCFILPFIVAIYDIIVCHSLLLFVTFHFAIYCRYFRYTLPFIVTLCDCIVCSLLFRIQEFSSEH